MQDSSKNTFKQFSIAFYNLENLFDTTNDPKTLDVSNFLSMTKGKNILVVGHSNTIPTLVNAILGSEKYKAIDDSNNANLYIITLSGDLKSDTVLEIN